MAKKKAPPKAAPVAAPAAAPAAVVAEEQPPASFTSAEAKKLAKLLKASDRKKRLDAIRVVSENHAYIAKGGCLLPLLESLVVKKKMEEVVQAAGKVIVEYLIGGDNGDPTSARDTTLAAMQEVKKKPAKYKLAEVLGNLILNPDPTSSWNAVRSLRSMAAVVASFPKGSLQASSMGAVLVGPGQPVERLCRHLIAQETRRAPQEGPESTLGASKGAEEAGTGDVFPWTVVRLHVVDTLGVMCGVSSEAIQTVVATGSVSCLLAVLRSITSSDSPDLPLLTSTLAVLFAVATAGAEADAKGGKRGNATESDASAGKLHTAASGVQSAELAALAKGGAWGAVYDALKGPCMARAAELQSAAIPKKAEAAISADLASCLDNMACCAEVLREMAMTGAGLDEEGALEAGVAAMSSILGMQGLPREEAAVANLMTGIVKAMGSIACLSEGNRVKVCSAGAAEKVLTLMAPRNPPVSGTAGAGAGAEWTSPPDTPHGRLLRKTAEKCLHHLVVSRITWMADDRALCDTSEPPEHDSTDGSVATGSSGPKDTYSGRGEDALTDRKSVRRSSRLQEPVPPPSLGPAYLTVDAVLAATAVESIDVRCRAIRLLARLMSSKRCASALGVSVVPALGRLVAWWLRTKDDPEAHRTPRPPEAVAPEVKSTGGKKGAAAAKAATTVAMDEAPVKDEATAMAEKLVAKKLEESDSTRVLRDEALAYALTIMLELAGTGQDECAAIGVDSIVELLASVLKRLPCTPEEFYTNSGGRCPTLLARKTAEATATPFVAAAPTSTPTSGAAGIANKGAESEGSQHAPSHGTSTKPDTSLDLSSTRRSQDSSNPRRLCCWRGEKSRDPEVGLFSPLDWGWDFEVGVSQEPMQPGLILRAAALRVLLAVVDGYDPALEAATACESAALASTTTSKGVVSTSTSRGGGAAATAVGSAAVASALAAGAKSVIKHALPVCVDLLSVDMRHGADDFGTAIAFDGGETGGELTAVDRDAVKLTVDTLSGIPVSPAEELVHEEIRLVCLKLLGSLLRLGGLAREALLFVADTHRNHWRNVLETEAGTLASPEPVVPTNPAKPTTKVVDKTGGKTEGGVGKEGSWTKPDTFCGWELRGKNETQSLLAALPYIRTVSVFLLPLRNPSAPVTDIMAALIGLRKLCREADYEVGGTQPEPHGPDDGVPLLPLNREATAGALVDTLAGVAVSVGALVPLVSIWGCAVAAAGLGELPAETTGMVNECQALIDYLICRGTARESFWSSLFSLEQISERKEAAAEAETLKKGKRKSKGAGKGGKGDKGSSPTSLPLENEDESKTSLPPGPPSPAGRPDPNLGPDRATWGKILNTRVDEQRTQTQGTTALLMATRTGLETAISNLILAGADPNVRGSDGRSSLMCALAQGMDDTVRGLVEAGANVDAIDVYGSSVLKYAFLCPSRQMMRKMMQKSPQNRIAEPAAQGSGSTTRTDCSSVDGQASLGDRPYNRTRTGSLSVSRSRSRSRSGSVSKERRRSSLSRSISFGGVSAAAVGSTDRRRLSRMSSMSAADSARAALREFGRRDSVGPLKTPRGTTVIRGDARMVPFILACGADPNVSSGTGGFPLHWAVVGTDDTLWVMNQQVRIVAGGDGGGRSGGNGNAQDVDGSQAKGTSDVQASKAELEAAPLGDQGGKQSKLDEHLLLLKVLVGAGSNLDSCNPDGITALHAAVIAGRDALAGALLDAGASPNISDNLGCLPLHYACIRSTCGYADLTKRLLALGMGRPLDKGVHRDDRKGKTRREKLVLDVGNIMRSGLREATAPSSITQHRATRSELLNFVSTEGFTPLHYVCDGRFGGRHAAATLLALSQRRTVTSVAMTARSGDDRTRNVAGPSDGCTDRVAILRWLLSEPELDPKVRVPRGATTLHLAAQIPGFQGGELVRSLIQIAGVNLDALDAPATSGVRSTVSCINRDCSPRTQPGASANNTDEGAGATPLRFSALHYALQAGSWEAASLLLSAGASVKPEGAFPPCLHVACLAGAPVSLVQRLLDGGGGSAKTPIGEAAVDAGNGSESSAITRYTGVEAYAASPLFLAASAGSADLITLLLSTCGAGTTEKAPAMDGEGLAVDRNGAAGVGSQNIWSTKHSPLDKRTPLHAAAIGGHTGAARALLDAEAACTRGEPTSWLNVTDATGMTPLGLAVSNGKWECAELFAASHAFDVRLAVEGGPSSTLVIAERTNMAIVDEGSGEMSALTALRESNALVMILLRRLAAAAVEDSSVVPVAAAATEEAQDVAGATDATDADGLAASKDGEACGEPLAPGENRTDCAPTKEDGSDEGHRDQSYLPPRRLLPVVHHVHPCFAEGVLYSNAKGIFIPDTPGRRKVRRASEVDGSASPAAVLVSADKHRAAVIIQSSARQAGARNAVAAKRRDSREDPPPSSAPSVPVASADGAGMTDPGKTVVAIQSQTRQTKARHEVPRRQE